MSLLSNMKSFLKIAIAIFILPHFVFIANAQENSMSEGYVFLKAVKDQDYFKVKTYMQKGANVNVRDYDDGATATYIAAQLRDPVLMTFLLDKDAKTDIPVRSTGETPLMVAVRLKAHKIISMLIEKKADLNIGDRNGETALHKATRLNDREAVKLLLEGGADWSITENTGRTPLDFANENRRLRQVAQLLQDSGAEY